MRAVMVSERYAGSDLLVLMAIALHADHDGGSSYPGNDRIATLSGCDNKTVARACRRLQGDGVLRKIADSKGRGHATYWAIDRAALRKGPRPDSERGTAAGLKLRKGGLHDPLYDSERGTPSPIKGDSIAHKGGLHDPPQCQTSQTSAPPPSPAATAARADKEEIAAAETAMGQHNNPAIALAFALDTVAGYRQRPLRERSVIADTFMATEAGSAAAALWRVDRDTDGLLTAWQEHNREELNLHPRPESN